MFRFAYANQNTASASATCAEAASCCTSRSSAYNCIVMGAIMMASIIISARLPSLPFPFWYWFFWPFFRASPRQDAIAEHFFQAIQQSGSAGIGGIAFCINKPVNS